MHKITILISGSGTNLQAIIDAVNTNLIPKSSIIRVISNRKSAFGLTRASNASIPTAYHNLVPYKARHPDNISIAREEYDTDLASLLLADSPDLVVCAGWMHILSPKFLEPLEKAGVRIINLHPALPGAFNGAGAIQRAWEAWQKGEIDKTGVMVHYVISEVDMGEPIVVKEIPFIRGADDDVEKLEERIHGVEHKAIVEGTIKALEQIEQERIKNSGQ